MATIKTEALPEAQRGRRGYGGHADALQEDIKRLLLELRLRPGDAIPSEASLIEQLGVSRGSLREALKSLQSLGILETRHGSGTFVAELSFERLAAGLVFHTKLGGADDLSTIAELADIREVLETALIRRVAGAIDDEQLAALDVLVERMGDRADHHQEADDLDRKFHGALYASLDRRLVNQLLEAFWLALAAARPALPQAFMTGHEAVEKHRAILDAVRSGDAEAAAAAMKDHFAPTREWVSLIGE
ncbi:FadR/GntR family transcriptional regulator [Microbacterium sp. 179-I 3D3 NHS]|uniref:FadR/GntR family transcriptional regulator n=1 Tax=unclassified Microbacterium TaxID=2609290 RepID=UPI0039A0F670